ncbi:MAG: PilZ domain-containing protein [Chloracidobacterium sp.]|nr:PilZ domain-containing protein [Chloracidobacterium sp.]MCC6826421.1 PilZ domain-containing protein [Acidobacteriota bacterium]MCO5334622.1 PilZ domain-containing protein [Pyrinomonadaceae bacterium]
METRDRRGGDERRSTKRFAVEIAVEWESGDSGRQPGTLNDVSFDGCFVLSSGNVNDGDDVKIFVPLSDGMKAEYAGRIANHVQDIGFGVSFGKLSEPQRELLVGFVRSTMLS